MHQLASVHIGERAARSDTARAGYSLIEIAIVLAIAAVLAPPMIASGAGLRASLALRRSQESAARLLTEARWTAIREGGASVEFTADPPWGWVVSVAGDTVMGADLGHGGVTLRLSRERPSSRVHYGPMGLGWVSSQTLRFATAGRERALVISSLGRVSRR